MQSWVRRLVALTALLGAAGLVVLARGVTGKAPALLAPLEGDAIVALASRGAVVMFISLAALIVFSRAGKARRGR